MINAVGKAVCLTLLFACSGMLYAVDQKAESYFNKGQYKKAAARWKKIGQRSSATGMSLYRLAQLHHDGLLGDVDLVQAIRWYRLSAEKGHVPSMNALGDIYLWGKEGVKNIDFAVFWFEKAAGQNSAHAVKALANLYMEPSLKDLLKARSLAARLISLDYQAANKLLSNIDAEIQKLNIQGSRDIHALPVGQFTIELDRFQSFAHAWSFIISNQIPNARIHRSIYSDFVITMGAFNEPIDGFEAITKLPLELKQLKPRVRALSVIKSQLLAAVEPYPAHWVFDQPDYNYTVQLFRGASLLQAIDYVDLHGLKNASLYKTKLFEYVVIAGVFDSKELAETVIGKLAPKMLIYNPVALSFDEASQDAIYMKSVFKSDDEDQNTKARNQIAPTSLNFDKTSVESRGNRKSLN